MKPCQVASSITSLLLPCRERESGGLRCERLDTHDEAGGHWVSDHTIRHNLAGNGYSCNSIEESR